MEPVTDPKRAELQRFARHLAGELDAALAAGRFDDLVLVAGPRLLGELRDALPKRVAERVRQDIAKDLAGLTPSQMEEHLRPDIWPLQQGTSR